MNHVNSESPFTLRRFETENRHLYYLPEPLFKTLVGRRSTYLIGSRGTGKTTLLKALHWEEQSSNDELRKKLAEIDGSKGYIGIYIKMPQTMADVFDVWLPSASEQFRASLFCLYLDFIWLQAACDAIASLLLAKNLVAQAGGEYQVTDATLQQFSELRDNTTALMPLSIKGFASLLYQKRRTMERWVYAGIDRTPDEIVSSLPVSQIGEFRRVVADQLAHFCAASSPGHEEWHFKVCLDETECLTPFQQLALNTSIRLTQAPVSFVVSYVRLLDVTSTLIHGISLQDADREVIKLDQMSDGEFADLAEGVATVRLQRLSPHSPAFSTRSALGSIDINELLFDILGNSASPNAKRLLGAAGLLAKTPYFRDVQEGTSVSPPIYQAYIVDRLALNIPSPSSTHWEKRRQHSAEIRKRMVAAYLCICKELGAKVRYAGAEMVLQLSDNCVRDYLNQLNSIFESAGVPLAEFGAERVSFKKQSVALISASNRKNETIPKSEIGSPVETLRLIDSLGRLTAHLQTSLKDMKSLKVPEQGLFVLEVDSDSPEMADVTRLITDAADAGFLKMRKLDNRTIKFRLHCSLAANYGLSYRGAYYECILRPGDVKPLYREENSDIRIERVNQLGALLLRDEPSLSLFEDVK